MPSLLEVGGMLTFLTPKAERIILPNLEKSEDKLKKFSGFCCVNFQMWPKFHIRTFVEPIFLFQSFLFIFSHRGINKLQSELLFLLFGLKGL